MNLLRNWLTSGKTRVIRKAEIVNSIMDIYSNATDRIDVCGNSRYPSTFFSLDLIKKVALDAKDRGVKQRYVFEITTENVGYCKGLVKEISSDFRYSEQIEANFILNEEEYFGSITLKDPQQGIYSELSEIVEQQHSIFESIWSKAMPAKDKIKEIEEGIEPEFFEVISDTQKARDIYINLAKSIENEGLFLLADSKAMNRADKLGIIDHFMKASIDKSAMIKIICPLATENSDIVRRISEEAPDIRILDGGVSSHSGLFIVNREKFLRFELKDPRAEDFPDAVGFVEYSNSKASISSSRSYFELIWDQGLERQKLREFEKLKEADKMKEEFINIAAHELRTPVQPILGLSQVLLSKHGSIEDFRDLLETINRNAMRLRRLTDNILDVTKIESKTLKLNKQIFNIYDVITTMLEDYKSNVREKDNVELKLLCQPRSKDSFFVKADKDKLAQVISNLLDNAIGYTNNGTISTTISNGKEKGDNNLPNDDIIMVSISDTGTGIDSEILPRLFTKFGKRSFQGSGLGLFIAKGIIEAHGGKIWAENNKDTEGATIYFTIPIAKMHQ